MAFDFTRGLFHVTRRGSFAHQDLRYWTHQSTSSAEIEATGHIRQKSSPTGRHKTTPEQFKHTFATNLHDHKWSQSRSKLEELTPEAIGEASFTPREPRNGCPNQAVAHRRCEFYQSETHVFTKWRNFRHRTGFMWPMTSRGTLLCSQMRFAQGKYCSKCDLLKENTVL